MYVHCATAEETISLGKKIGQRLQPNDVLCFFGDLGSGKTTFIKGLVEGATGLSASVVSSPTFSYLNIYSGSELSVYHFDLYRLHDSDEFISMGFDEYMHAGGICCIEWSERIAEMLPAGYMSVAMNVSEMGGRTIQVSRA